MTEMTDHESNDSTQQQPQAVSNPLTQSDVPLNPLTGASFSANYWELLEQRKKLTVWKYKEQFMELLDRQDIQFILLEAETGSGKTTQIPQWCIEWLRKTQPHSRQMVCCTQPRRLATLTVAKRVAEEMDVELGKEVGYSMRFEEAVSFQTVLKYCTDGVLLSEATRNNQLEQYGIIVLDEVHERSMTTDVMMGLVKQIASARPELRVVVMSATLGAGNFFSYFAQRRVELAIPGRNFEVEIVYNLSPLYAYSLGYYSTMAESNYFELAIEKVKEVHTQERNTPGDILLFMTGEEEIEAACDKLNDYRFGPDVGELRCLPLYSALRNDQQQLIFERQTAPTPGRFIDRRCIVATNIAETSMTIEDVVFVIDPGFCKRKQFDPVTRIESLLVQPITKASAIQRAGRAGRTRDGKCFRLYTERDYDHMKPVDPEIRHSNLANVVLRMKKCGVKDLETFDFMDAPPRELLVQAITLLTHLEAFDANGGLTSLGTQMADLPVDPPLARMLIESIRLRCSREVITIAGMLSSQNCFYRPKKKQAQADARKALFTHDQGDHLTLLRVFNAFTASPVEVEARMQWCYDNFLNYRALQYAADVCTQLEEVMKRRLGIAEILSADPCLPISVFNINKALVAGSFMKVAFFKPTSHGVNPRAKQGHYVIVESLIGENNTSLLFAAAGGSLSIQAFPEYQIHPSSVLFRQKAYGMRPDCVLYEQAIQLKGGKHYLRDVTAIRPEWLTELAPNYYGQLRTINAELQRRLVPADEAQKKLMEELVTSLMKALQL